MIPLFTFLADVTYDLASSLSSLPTDVYGSIGAHITGVAGTVAGICAGFEILRNVRLYVEGNGQAGFWQLLSPLVFLFLTLNFNTLVFHPVHSLTQMVSRGLVSSNMNVSTTDFGNLVVTAVTADLEDFKNSEQGGIFQQLNDALKDLDRTTSEVSAKIDASTDSKYDPHLHDYTYVSNIGLGGVLNPTGKEKVHTFFSGVWNAMLGKSDGSGGERGGLTAFGKSVDAVERAISNGVNSFVDKAKSVIFDTVTNIGAKILYLLALLVSFLFKCSVFVTVCQAYIYLTLLGCLGAFNFAFSTLTVMNSSWVEWLERYIQVSLWVPLVFIVQFVMLRIVGIAATSGEALLGGRTLTTIVLYVCGMWSVNNVKGIASWFIQGAGAGNVGGDITMAGMARGIGRKMGM